MASDTPHGEQMLPKQSDASRRLFGREGDFWKGYLQGVHGKLLVIEGWNATKWLAGYNRGRKESGLYLSN